MTITYTVAGTTTTDWNTALAKTGNITVKGTASDISGALATLQTNNTRIGAVNITGTDKLAITGAQALADKDVLLKLSSAALSVADAGATLATDINGLRAINSKISSIQSTDGNSSMTLTANQATTNKAVLLKLSSASLNISDTAANIASNYSTLDAVYSKTQNIAETDNNSNVPVSISYSTYKAAKNGAAIDNKIGSLAGVAISNFSGNADALNTLLNDANVKSVTVNDSVANISKYASSLSNAKLGASSITVTDKFANVYSDSGKALIQTTIGSTNLNIVNVTAKASEVTSANLNTIKAQGNSTILGALQLSIADTASAISNNATQIAAWAADGSVGGKISSTAGSQGIQVLGGSVSKPAVLQMTSAQYNTLHSKVANDNSTITYQLSNVAYGDIANHNLNTISEVSKYSISDSASNLTIPLTNATSLGTFLSSAKLSSLDITTVAYTDLAGTLTKISNVSDANAAKIKSISIEDSALNLTSTRMTALDNNSLIKNIKVNDANNTVADAKNYSNYINDSKVNSIGLKLASTGAIATFVQDPTQINKKITLIGT